jgi:protein CpxP
MKRKFHFFSDKENKMRGFKAVFTVISAAALFCAFTAGAQGLAQGPGQGFGAHRPPLERALGSGRAGRWWNDQTMVDKLNLTDDQRKGMDAILLEHQGNLIDMHASVEKAELAMEPLMSADQPSEQLILAQIDKIAQARAELEKANARFLLAIRAKLTPDQWKQLQAARAERRQLRQNGARPNGVGPRHMMRPPGGPAGAPPGAPQGGPGPQFAPPDGPGPEGMLPPGPALDLAPGVPPAAEAGAIE